MNVPGYLFGASCPRCAGELSHVTSSRPTATEASAIVACGDCGEEWQILVRMCVVPRPGRAANTARKRAHRERAAASA